MKMQKKKNRTEISQLTEALLRHTHIFSLIKSDHILFTELHTDKVVTSRKERKYSNDLIVRDVQLFVFTWLFRTNRNIHSKEH